MAEGLDFSQVCKGCPVMTGIVLEQAKLEGDTSLRAEMANHVYSLGKVSLNEAAEAIDCQAVEKQLPATPNPMPEIGSDELEAYARACPSFDRYLDILTAKMQQPQE